MTKGTPQKRKKKYQNWLANLPFIAVVIGGPAFAGDTLGSAHSAPQELAESGSQGDPSEVEATVRATDAAFQSAWTSLSLTPAPPAPSLTVARRLSLALTGTVPSLQEIRAMEDLPEKERIAWWLGNLLADRRCSDYLAERFARAFVGIENGPFVVYRRRRLVTWLSDEILHNRPYDEMARALIGAAGGWANEPGMNFIVVSSSHGRPDEAKLAARVTRAFLGARIDCVQCHDGKLGSTWVQKDFHQLAAFFAQVEFATAGLRDNPRKKYKVRYVSETSEDVVPPAVPWEPGLTPETGSLRQRLASWVTAPGNRPFARAIVNRTWALLFNRPLVTPVDDIPLKGPFPPGLEILADDFTAHQCDLQRLIRVIAATRVFQMESRSADADHPMTEEAELQWAAFPMTGLRPEQIAGSVFQSSSLTTLDAGAHLRFRDKTASFLNRYGDTGEDEFGNQSGTIPQRLLMMNGEMVRHLIGASSAPARIGLLTPDTTAVETAYLAVLSRRPMPEEAAHFALKLHGIKGGQRTGMISDLFWTLFNSTEFSWNH